MEKLEGKVAFITGATSGIGETTAKTLAHRGARVVVSGRRETLGQRVVDQIRSEGGEASFIVTDVNSEESISKAISGAIEQYGSLDIGVNNAGIALETLPLADCDGEKLQQMLQTNVMGVFWCMKYEIRQMLKQESGAIVNLASIAGLNGIPNASTYAATKHAIVGLTKSAALDYGTKNIQINAVAPGAIRTDMLLQQKDFGTYDEKMVIDMFPMKRMGNPQEIANGIVWLCSDESSYTTGHILAIDGGLYCSLGVSKFEREFRLEGVKILIVRIVDFQVLPFLISNSKLRKWAAVEAQYHMHYFGPSFSFGLNFIINRDLLDSTFLYGWLEKKVIVPIC